MKTMTDGQYRAIVAWLNFWPATGSIHEEPVAMAIKDIGITISRDEVINELWKAGHKWSVQGKTLKFIP